MYCQQKKLEENNENTYFIFINKPVGNNVRETRKLGSKMHIFDYFHKNWNLKKITKKGTKINKI